MHATSAADTGDANASALLVSPAAELLACAALAVEEPEALFVLFAAFWLLPLLAADVEELFALVDGELGVEDSATATVPGVTVPSESGEFW